MAAAVEARVDSIEHCSFMTDEGVDQGELVAVVAASGITLSITAGIAPGPADPIVAARLPALVAHVRRLRDAGARCVMSTDTGISLTKSHDCLVYVVAQAVQLLGMPVERALATCTSLAADALGIEWQAGRVCPGLLADLLVVDGLVETDPDAIRSPLLVLRGGVDVGRHG
ncbi:MAG: amidohydrolase family protein [Humibacillus sp.]|nr:amidohydrolase family protein [Humibacillus sp.]MDN5779640.1 amidohydrolase family protein [Humibacillus sp.]